MRRLVTFFSLASLLAAASPASSKAEPLARKLVLIATGANNAVTDRYLGLFCQLLKAEPAGPRYNHVAVYRGLDDAATIAERLFADPTTRNTQDRTAVEDFAQALTRGGQYCIGQPSQADDTAASIDVVQIEWMEGDSFRLQKATIPSPKDKPRLVAPQYVDIKKDRAATARAIGVATLEIPPSTLFPMDAPTWAAPPWGRCAVGTDACVLVNMDFAVALPMHDSYWVKASEIDVQVRSSCAAPGKAVPVAGLHPGKIEVTRLPAGELRTYSFETVTAGDCLVELVATYDSFSLTLPLDPGIQIRAGGVILDGFVDDMEGLGAVVGKVKTPLLPGVAPELRTRIEHDSPLMKKASECTVAADEITAWTVRLRTTMNDALGRMTAASGNALRDKLRLFLDGRGDRLPYDVLYQKSEDFCETTLPTLRKPNDQLSTWKELCASAVSREKTTFIETGRRECPMRATGFIVRPTDDARVSAVPPLRTEPYVEWNSLRGGEIGMPSELLEDYWVNAILPSSGRQAAGRQQSYPVRLTVLRFGPREVPLGLDLHMGLDGGHITAAGRTVFGMGYILFLEASVLQGVFGLTTVASLLSGGSKPDGTGTVNAWRVGGELNMRPFFAISGFASKISGEPLLQGDIASNLILEFGLGYMVYPGYWYSSARLGWRWRNLKRPLGIAASYLNGGPTDLKIGALTILYGW